MQKSSRPAWLKPQMLTKAFGTAFFVYLFFGFMLLLLIVDFHEAVTQRHTQKPKQRNVFFAERYQPRFVIRIVKPTVNFLDAFLDHVGVVDADVVALT